MDNLISNNINNNNNIINNTITEQIEDQKNGDIQPLSERLLFYDHDYDLNQNNMDEDDNTDNLKYDPSINWNNNNL